MKVLISLNEQKYAILQDIKALVKEQNELLFSENYERLNECLDKTEKAVQALKEVNIEINEQDDIVNDKNSAVCFDIENFNSNIRDITSDICQMYLKCQKNAELKLAEVKNNIKSINLSKRSIESYDRANIFEDSIYFNQSR